MSQEKYLQLAIELSQKSFEAGGFPAGAVLVSKTGKVYKSGKSVAYRHGELMVMDEALDVEGFPLEGATIYASMEPCLMCLSKMYWSGVENVQFVIPKSEVKAEYGYEDNRSSEEHIAQFFKKPKLVHDPELLQEALGPYQAWIKKIEG